MLRPDLGPGVPCRVCGVDDERERVQRDLHLDCVETAAREAKRRSRKRRRVRGARTIPHAELVRRLARDRAGIPDPTPAAPPKRRGPKPRIDRDQHDEEMSELLLSGDDIDAIDLITRSIGGARGA